MSPNRLSNVYYTIVGGAATATTYVPSISLSHCCECSDRPPRPQPAVTHVEEASLASRCHPCRGDHRHRLTDFARLVLFPSSKRPAGTEYEVLTALVLLVPFPSLQNLRLDTLMEVIMLPSSMWRIHAMRSTLPKVLPTIRRLSRSTGSSRSLDTFPVPWRQST